MLSTPEVWLVSPARGQARPVPGAAAVVWYPSTQSSISFIGADGSAD